MEHFGFVRYSKVKDIDKLLRAVNNVRFGDCKVVAKVSSYDRFGNKREDGIARVEGEKIIEGGKHLVENEKILEGEKRKMSGLLKDGGGAGKQVVDELLTGGRGSSLVVQSKQTYVPKYISIVDDKTWASKGLVVSVLNGDSIPVLQRRIFDAGFDKLVIIPLGANKVLLKTLDDGDVSSLLSGATDFFNNFFSKPVWWNKDMLFRERGGWVRIYGVPLHAWNIDFLKLCVLDCGCLLKVDDIIVDRDRFDYARILLSTTSLKIINTGAQVMIDGIIFDFKIIEEWGFSVGEDACLFDDEESIDEEPHGIPESHVEVARCGDVDDLVHHLSEDWNREVNNQCVNHSSPVFFGSKNESPLISRPPTPLFPLSKEPDVGLTPQLRPSVETTDMNEKMIAQATKGVGNKQPGDHFCITKRIVKRTSSCPPGRVRSSVSGPWSLEWVNKQFDSDNRQLLKPRALHASSSKRGHKISKKKGSDYLCAQSLKRIARLSDNDRKEVLRVLQRKMKQRKAVSGSSNAKLNSNVPSPSDASQSSVNNDWENLLVLNTNKKTTVDDVCDIGKKIGLKFEGDKNNKFDVLSGVGEENSWWRWWGCVV